ncbi:MAG: aldo/keto reductase [Prevotellaceae bacterium]|nr:aldo/keto reductase [Prevotellaceae bacterium]
MNKDISRRDFLKTVGVAGLATAGLASCANKKTDTPHASSANSEIPKDKMTYRTCHTTGDRVSLLGYGMMRLPTKPKSGTKEGEDEEIDQEAVNRLVDYAIEHGVNYFDTSPAYCRGFSERSTGIALKRHPRNKFFVATKLSNFDPSTWSREASIEMYRNSFKELQVDTIDYLLLHAVGGGRDGMEELHKRYIDNGVLDFLLEERKAGRIRNLGFSYHGDIKVYDYLLSQHDRYKWDFVQIQMNYLDWKLANKANPSVTNSDYLYGELKKLNIPVVIMEPLLGGRLAKVPDFLVARLKQREPELSVASWAFRFAGTYPEVLTVLSGMTLMEHLQDNLRSYAPLKPLTDSELAFLQEIATEMVGLNTIPCNDCKYCMPCPYGIDIPANLLYYNKCVNEGNVPHEAQDAAYRKSRRAFLIGYDRSVPKLRQADHCIACGECVSHCPQRIKIPRELQRIDEMVEKLKREI